MIYSVRIAVGRWTHTVDHSRAVPQGAKCRHQFTVSSSQLSVHCGTHVEKAMKRTYISSLYTKFRSSVLTDQDRSFSRSMFSCSSAHLSLTHGHSDQLDHSGLLWTSPAARNQHCYRWLVVEPAKCAIKRVAIATVVVRHAEDDG